jgi:hypothetical protein
MTSKGQKVEINDPYLIGILITIHNAMKCPEDRETIRGYLRLNGFEAEP